MSVELTEAEVLQTIQRLLDWHARSFQPDSAEWEAARELRDKLWDARGDLFGRGAQIRFNVTTSPDKLAERVRRTHCADSFGERSEGRL